MSSGWKHPIATQAERRNAPRRGRLAAVVAIGLTASTAVVAAPRFVPEAVAAGTTFVVDSTGDAPDVSDADGICATSVETGSVCTLRAAIKQANATPGHDRIEFDLPGPSSTVHTIRPQSTLPILSDDAGVTIDGYTQGDARPNQQAVGTDAVLRVELRGTGPSGIDGIFIRSTNNTVRGLALYDFNQHIRLFGNNLDGLGSGDLNTIVGNFIGTDATASFRAADRVVTANGVHLEQGASQNRIGAPGAANRNLVSGLADRGIALFNNNTDANIIQNNLIGLAPDGVSRLANQGHGIDINFDSSDNLIGGSLANQANVISGNRLSGVEISHNASAGDTSGNRIVGNLIGTTADGSAGTFYTKNDQSGVNLEGNARCADSCPADIARNEVEGNVIVGSPANVLIWKGAHENLVVGNSIGLLASGVVPASRIYTTWAVLVQTGAFDNTIAENTIAGVPRGIHVKPDNSYPDTCRVDDVVCPEDAVFATVGNTFSRNSIFDVDAGLGIDLYDESVVDPSDWVAGPGNASPLVNFAIQPPTVLAATTDSITVDGCSGCTIEVFETPEPGCLGCYESFGRGKRFVASAVQSATTPAVITLRSTVADAYVVESGVLVSATVTDAAGNTSEFSQRLTVEPGVIGPPVPTTTVAGSTTTLVATTAVPTTTMVVVPTTVSPPTTGGNGERFGAGASATDAAVRCGRSRDC